MRTTEQALGQVFYGLTPEAEKNRHGKRSLYVSAPIKNGELFTKKNISSVRPGYGLAPKYYDQIIGNRAKIDLEVGDRLQWDVIEQD